MFQLSPHSRLLKSIAFTILVVGLAAAQAPAGARRPAAVPAGFVITPFGYYHPSCVGHLAQGDILRKDKNAVEHADGTFEEIQKCAYPHFRADGERVVGDEPAGTHPPDISHAWIEYASIHDSPNYGQIYTEWDVPPNPADNDGQTVYLFNGLEDYSGDVTIIQPVLGWNSDYSAAWGIAAWNCCYTGDVWEGTPQKVKPGDHLEGYVFNNCSPGTTKCTSWDIVIMDDENGKYSQLLSAPNHGQTFNWAFGGVLEVYNIVQCGDYPPSDYAGGIGFTNQSVLNDDFDIISGPAWKVVNLASGLTPQCNYGGSTPKQVILTY